MRLGLSLAACFMLSACAVTPRVEQPSAPPSRPPVQTRPIPPSAPPPPPVDGFRQPDIMQGPGLTGIIREAAPSILRQFGTPRLDVAEGDMRKLQFAATACVMDIYLYPLRPGAEPVATWIETRRSSDGAAVDTLSCMQALRRPG